MTKRRIIKRGPVSIKNYHLIGAGGKQIKPVGGKWVAGYHKALGRPSSKLISTRSVTLARKPMPPTKLTKIPVKMRLKSSTSISTPKPGGFKPNIPSSKLKGLTMLKKMSSTSPVKAPPKPKVIRKGR